VAAFPRVSSAPRLAVAERFPRTFENVPLLHNGVENQFLVYVFSPFCFERFHRFSVLPQTDRGQAQVAIGNGPVGPVSVLKVDTRQIARIVLDDKFPFAVSAQRCQYIVPIVDIEEANAVAADQSQFSGQEVPKNYSRSDGKRGAFERRAKPSCQTSMGGQCKAEWTEW
jgi:hypothetical protein